MKETVWSHDGFVLYNPAAGICIAMRDGVPSVTHNFLDAHVFSAKSEAKALIPSICESNRHYGEYPDDPEVVRSVDEKTKPTNWKVRQATRTITIK